MQPFSVHHITTGRFIAVDSVVVQKESICDYIYYVNMAIYRTPCIGT